MSEQALVELNEARDERKLQTIELDCAPGMTRPGDLIAGVIKGTGLEAKEAAGKFFGEWTWVYNDVPAEDWKKLQPVLKERVTALYHQGLIRFGSW